MRRFATLIVLLIAASSRSARAQWVEQTFELSAGWNSVFLEVDPAPSDADAVFAGLPLETVWVRVPEDPVQGPPDCANPEDPACVPPNVSGWWVWVPASDPSAAVRTLRLVRGGRVYLLKAREAATWRVTGGPNGAVTPWRGGLNLAGLHVVETVGLTPTFTQYFSGSTAHAGTAVYALGVDGAPVRVNNPSLTRVGPGTGYWISSLRAATYDGPIAIDRGSLRGIDFGQDVIEHRLVLENTTSTARTVNATYVASSPVPLTDPASPSQAGDVPLVWRAYQSGLPPEQAYDWPALGTASWPMSAASTADARRTLQLSVLRTGLAAATVDLEGFGSRYQGLLRLTDGLGFRRWLAVRTQVLGGSVVAGASSAPPGLYFGHVTVEQVAWASAGARIWTNADPSDPSLESNPDQDTLSLRPAPASFTFPVLIHRDGSGNDRMLTEVTLLFSPADTQLQTPDRYVLATPSCGSACDALMAGSLQDGQPFARRISTAAFAFDGDLDLSGDLGTTLSGQTTLAPDHRLNPFRHRYHPDHDCSSEGECFEVSRTFTFSFASEPPAGQSPAGWGETVLGGEYTESLGGLHRDPIEVAGRFELRRVSNVSELNVQN